MPGLSRLLPSAFFRPIGGDSRSRLAVLSRMLRSTRGTIRAVCASLSKRSCQNLTSDVPYPNNLTSSPMLLSKNVKNIRSAYCKITKINIIYFRLKKYSRRLEACLEQVSGFHEGRFPPAFSACDYEFEMYVGRRYPEDACWDAFAQWHGSPNWWFGERHSNPPLMLMIQGGAYFAVIRSREGSSGLHPGPLNKHHYRETSIYLGALEGTKGRWTNWRVQVKWSYTKLIKGYIMIYLDNKLVCVDVQPNCFEEWRGGPYMKIGIYGNFDRSADSSARRGRVRAFRSISGGLRARPMG